MSGRSLQSFKSLSPAEHCHNEGWHTFLNYVGGSCIYVRRELANRSRSLSPAGTLPTMRVGARFLDYDGGSYTYVRRKCTSRFKVLESSRNTANNEVWRTFLNYARREFAGRFTILESSWNIANNEGWRTLLHYVGGSYIYVRREFCKSSQGPSAQLEHGQQ